MNHGEILDKNWKINEFYELINSYYNNPVMTKTDDKDNYGIYMCQLHSLLSVDKRYIIAIVPNDNNNKGDKVPLENLDWVSFQTRVLQQPTNLPKHKYSVKRQEKYQIFIEERNKDENAAYYTCEYPAIITLLYTKNNRKYQKTGTLVNALETFNTIISLNQ